MAQNPNQKRTIPHQNQTPPLVITGITSDSVPRSLSTEPVRLRANIELSSQVSLCLDNVCEVTGLTRSQVINSALVDALPGLIERADTVYKRSKELLQGQAAKKR